MSTEHYLTSNAALARQVGDDTVILDLHSEAYYSLNEVGSTVWNRLASPASLAELCELITRCYLVDPRTCENDLRHLLDELLQHGLVNVVTSTP